MSATQVKGHDIETSSFETKVDTAVTSGAAANDVQPALPVGVILMYNGSGIADAASRTEDIGDRTGDTISLPGWKACNGNAGTPNMLNRFLRMESASGNTGGSDDAIVVSHTHTNSVGNQSANHDHNVNLETGNGSLLGYAAASAATCEAINSRVGNNNQAHNHTVTIDNAGSSGTGANKPAFYSLIPIIKMS